MDFHALLLLTLIVQTLGTDLDLDLITKCSEHLSCESDDHSTEHVEHLKLNSSLPNWYELCNCDRHCHLFGDCCVDAPALDQLKIDQWSFVKARSSLKAVSMFMSLMQSRCPDQWPKDDFVRAMCEHSALDPVYYYLLSDIEHYLLFDSNDQFRNWHVTSRRTLITYRNLYCSVCHNDTDVDAWSQRMLCLPDSKCTTTYQQIVPELLNKEKIKRAPLQSKVYSYCSLGWYKIHAAHDLPSTLATIKKCILYYAPVVVQENKSKRYLVFKNQYCAQCNNYEPKSHQCPSVAVGQLTQNPALYNKIEAFDADFQVGGFINDNGTRCWPGAVYNPLASSCQAVLGDANRAASRYSNQAGSICLGKWAKLASVSFIILTLRCFI